LAENRGSGPYLDSATSRTEIVLAETIQLAAGRAGLLAHDRFGVYLAIEADLEKRAGH